MSLRKIGETGLALSSIGLGCWQFSKNTGIAGSFWPELSNETTLNIINTSIKGNINWFDTAELYGWGKSEESLTQSLIKLNTNSTKHFIATKWWPLFRFSSSIRKTIKKRLNYLNGFPITLHQIHMPYGFSSIEKEMNVMADLVDEGLIKHIGVSNFNQKQMIRAYNALEKRGIHLTSNQMEYSILNRDIEKNGIMETAKKLNISIIAYSPLAQGIATGKFHDNPDLIKNMHTWRRKKLKRKGLSLTKSLPVINELKKIAKIHNSTTAQIALSWLIGFNKNTFAIPGASNENQCKDNADAMKIFLSNEELERLDYISRSI
ncbi:MAG: aldo/keto reductase [Flavobacteriales bacterium]|jgi:aryl-alcohol dehydrogenase-like predicted oxidoreductase|nr:aldo/keto reductase [Flavobacteriales bacterium]|tara:strand:+ start:9167 stop:10126 length:960 start_codon:yes stop_codon:yes gene_type:complete